MEKITTSLSRSHAPHPVAAKAAQSSCPLLITGATGTGKGFLAQWIHENGPRADKPFVPVNCGAIPENLIDSQLFGHAKGAFSDATAEHVGLVRSAEGGTILFDEISELPAAAQTRLLRLLEEREVQPVGHSRPVKVNVRVIAATNVDLREAVRQGRFRQDLYYRLDVLTIALRPLRERLDALPALLNRFNDEFSCTYRQVSARFGDDALVLLNQYHWPGNVRELRTFVERLHVLIGEKFENEPVTADDVTFYGQLPVRRPMVASRMPAPASLGWQSAKVKTVREALQSCRGNVSRAASHLGVHRSTIYRWLAENPIAA